MRIKTGTGYRVFNVFNIVALLLLCFLMVYPIFYVLFCSLSDPLLLAQHKGVLFLPIGLTFDVYRIVFSNRMIGSGYLNTLIYLILGLVINMTLTAIGAYALSRKRVLLSNFLMYGIVFTMLFSGGLIPTYLVVFKLGLIDTVWAMVLPGAISTWNLIILRTSFQGIPAEMEEAARIDGAGDLRILVNVIVPVSKSILAVMVLFYGVGIWNSWFGASIYLKSRDMYPLQLILRKILILDQLDNMMMGAAWVDMHAIGDSLKYATVIVATVPILLIYPLLQKYFVHGVMIGAIKG